MHSYDLESQLRSAIRSQCASQQIGQLRLMADALNPTHGDASKAAAFDFLEPLLVRQLDAFCSQLPWPCPITCIDMHKALVHVVTESTDIEEISWDSIIKSVVTHASSVGNNRQTSVIALVGESGIPFPCDVDDPLFDWSGRGLRVSLTVRRLPHPVDNRQGDLEHGEDVLFLHSEGRISESATKVIHEELSEMAISTARMLATVERIWCGIGEHDGVATNLHPFFPVELTGCADGDGGDCLCWGDAFRCMADLIRSWLDWRADTSKNEARDRMALSVHYLKRAHNSESELKVVLAWSAIEALLGTVDDGTQEMLERCLTVLGWTDESSDARKAARDVLHKLYDIRCRTVHGSRHDLAIRPQASLVENVVVLASVVIYAYWRLWSNRQRFDHSRFIRAVNAREAGNAVPMNDALWNRLGIQTRYEDQGGENEPRP